jgi:peptidylprolyl isomerase
MIQSVILTLVLAQSGGLTVTDVHPGTGAKAAKGDVLAVIYKGTLKDGKVFDENMETKPYAFTLGATPAEVIQGWEKGLLGMKVGGERKLVIPPALAFGSRGNGDLVPPNATLFFDVKLLRIDSPGVKPAITVVDIAKGTGKPAKNGDSVGVYYTGTFLNGYKFDSSYDHKDAQGKPSIFNVTLGQHAVVPGFEQGLIGLKVGGKRKVTIPYQLGYGANGSGDTIPAKSTLIFVLERKS